MPTLISLAMAVLASLLTEETCGATMMEQTFSKYPGPPTNYTVAQIMADFPFGPARPTSATPDNKRSGLAFSKGHGRGYVGDGVLRSEHPQGVRHRLNLCNFSRIVFSNFPCCLPAPEVPMCRRVS
jgi:hypothetical protein